MPYAYGDNYWEVALTGASRTATTYSPHLVNQCYPGFVLVVNVTAVPGAAPVLTPFIQVLYPYTTTWLGIWIAAAPFGAVAVYRYALFPGLLAAAAGTYTEVHNTIIPRDFRVAILHGNANAVTYQASICYVKS